MRSSLKTKAWGSMENIRLGNVISVPMQTARGETSCKSEAPATHSPTRRGMKSSFAWILIYAKLSEMIEKDVWAFHSDNSRARYFSLE